MTPAHRTAVLLATVGLVLTTTLAPAFAGDSPFGDVAASWPTDYAPYSTAAGDPISDEADNNPGSSDLSAGAAEDLPSVYFTSDGTHIFFRVRVRSDPTSKNGGFSSTSWLVSVAVGGTQAAVIGAVTSGPSGSQPPSGSCGRPAVPCCWG